MNWNYETVDFHDIKGDFVTIILYQPHWELKDWIRRDGFYFLKNVNKVKNLIDEVLALSVKNNASVLVLPELTIPSELISTINEWTKLYSTIVIAGSHYIKTEKGYINRAAIISNGNSHYSEKLIPSPLEKSPLPSESLLPGKKLLFFKNTKIGNFFVLICADYLEDNLTSEIFSKFEIDFLFVLALHKDSSRYHNKMDSNCKSSEYGFYLVYSNNSFKDYGDGCSAFFGNMDRVYYNKLKGRVTDGKQTTKIIELSNKTEYAVIKANLAQKRPFLGKTIYSKPNVEVLYPANIFKHDVSSDESDKYYQRFSQEYIGRENSVDFVLNYLQDPHPKEHFLLLIGVGGMGKSHLLSECRERLGAKELIHEECNSSYNIKTLFNICKIPYPEELEEADTIQQHFLDEFCDRDITLILDDLYEVIDSEFRNILPKLAKIPKGKILLVSRVIPKELTLTGMQINSYEISGLQKKDFIVFMQNYIQGEDKYVSLTEKDLNKIYNKTQGYPLGGQLIIDLLDIEEDLDVILKDLPKFQAIRDPEGKGFSLRLLNNIFKKGNKKEINLLCEFSALYEAPSIGVIKQLPSYDLNAFEALVKRRRFIQKEENGSFHCHAMIKDFAYEKLSDKENIHNIIGIYYENILFEDTNLNSEILSKTINHYKRIGSKKLKEFGRKIGEKYQITNVKSLIEKNVRDTIRNYEGLLVIYPEKVAYWNELGMAYRENNQKQLAIETFLKVIEEIDPKHLPSYNELGITYRENNQFDGAIEIIEKSLEINPKEKRSLLNLLQCFLYFKPDKIKAANYYDKLDNMRPAHRSFRNQRKSYKVSIENLDRIWNLSIENFKIYDKYCFAAIQYKAYHTIIPLLFDLYKKYPENSKTLSRLGKTLSNPIISRHEEGQKYLLKAIELFESNNNEQQLIGHIFFYLYNLLNNEKYELLKIEIKRFKNKIVHLPDYYQFLGNYYIQLGNPENEVIEHFQKAIEISSSNDEKTRSVNTLLNYLIGKNKHKYKAQIERLKDHLKLKNT